MVKTIGARPIGEQYIAENAKKSPNTFCPTIANVRRGRPRLIEGNRRLGGGAPA